MRRTLREANEQVAVMLLPSLFNLSVEVHMGGKPDRLHVKVESSVVHNRRFSGGVCLLHQARSVSECVESQGLL